MTQTKGSLPIRLVLATREHLEGIVQCHQAAFPGEFATLLGRPFLWALYGYYIDQPGGIVFVAVEEGTDRVGGLVQGGKPELRARFTRWHLPLLALWSLRAAIVYPYVRRRLRYHFGEAARNVLRKLRLAKANAKNPPAPEDPPGTWSNLLSICTHPGFRSRGVGRLLMDAFCAESARRGYKTMRLSVHNNNKGAIALYTKCGWRVAMVTPNGTYFKRSVEEPA